MSGLKVDNLTMSFDGTPALTGLSFSAGKGEMYGLIGPDGAGKTTFMRIAACLLLQDTGEVTVGGYDTRKKARHVKEIIGYMPQTFSLYPDLSVMENLSFFASLFGVGKHERRNRIDKLLEFSRLGPFLKRRAGNLSGGMKQKLALSCTLIHTPEVLFLDEPTTGVDPLSRREFWNLLAEVKSSGTTIIVSTPYMDEAERCDRVGFIFNGATIAEGKPEDIPEQFRYEILAVHAPDIVRNCRNMTFPVEVLDVQTFGDRLHLTVKDSNHARESIGTFLEEHGISDVEIASVKPSIEDVFVERMRNE